MFRIVVTLLAALATFATAVAVPLVYVMGMDHVTLGSFTVPLIQSGLMIYLAYVAFNVMSGLVGQEDTSLFWLDYLASWIAWFSINATAVYVMIGLIQGYDEIKQITDIPFAKWLLGGLVLFSWIDVGLLQGHKHRTAHQYINAQRAVAPPPPVNPPVAVAQAASGSYVGAFFLLLLGLIVLGVLAFAFNANSCTEKYVGTSDQGTRMYSFDPDCK